MKPNQHYIKILKSLPVLFMLCMGLKSFGQVKIGENETQISPYALLELESTSKALLIPRMSTAQRDAVFNQQSPAGLVIFNTDIQKIQYFAAQIDPQTGATLSTKAWNSTGREVVSTSTAGASSGELYFNEDSNLIYVWNADQGLWFPVNSGGSSAGVSDPSATGTGTGGTGTGGTGTGTGGTGSGMTVVNTGTGLPTTDLLKEVSPGTLYVDSSTTGSIHIAVDDNNDGVADAWKSVSGAGAPGPAGPAGPAGPVGPAGTIPQTVLTSLISSTITSSTIQGLETLTVLSQDASGTISYLDEDGGTSIAEVTSKDPTNLLTSGPDFGSLLTPTDLGDALTNQLSSTMTDIISNTLANQLSSTLTNLVSSNLSSSTIQALETNTSFSQNASGSIVHTNEDGTTVTATLISTDAGNLLVAGSDSGSLLTANVVNSNLTSATIQALETNTSFSQAPSGVIAHTNEDGVTATVTLISTDAGNLLVAGTDNGSLLTANVVNSNLTSATIQALETNTSFSQAPSGDIAHTNEDGVTATATLISTDGGNLLTAGTDRGALLTRTTINNNIYATTVRNFQSITGFVQNADGSIIHTNEISVPVTARVISADAGNVITAGSDRGSLLTRTTLNQVISEQTGVSASGILFPSLTTTERDAITSPANGLVIFNTSSNTLQIYISGVWGTISITP